MNVVTRPRRMTRDQFFDWAQQQDRRYEFDGFEPVEMTGGNLDHDLLSFSIRKALDALLGGSPHAAFGPNAGMATVGQTVRYPDALVARRHVGGDQTLVVDPVVVFEVVSKTSGHLDRVIKVAEYWAVPSIARYAIVELTSARIAVHERVPGEAAWRVSSLCAGQVLAIPEIGISVPVDILYAGVSAGAS